MADDKGFKDAKGFFFFSFFFFLVSLLLTSFSIFFSPLSFCVFFWFVDFFSVWIAMTKVDAPKMALKIIDEAIQMHGAHGLSQDSELSELYKYVRHVRLADGPDVVHLKAIGQYEIAKGKTKNSPFPSSHSFFVLFFFPFSCCRCNDRYFSFFFFCFVLFSVLFLLFLVLILFVFVSFSLFCSSSSFFFYLSFLHSILFLFFQFFF